MARRASTLTALFVMVGLAGCGTSHGATSGLNCGPDNGAHTIVVTDARALENATLKLTRHPNSASYTSDVRRNEQTTRRDLHDLCLSASDRRLLRGDLGLAQQAIQDFGHVGP